MATRITMYWNFGKQGWSESWYTTKVMPTTKANLQDWDDIYDARDKLVAGQAFQVGYRLADTEQQRKTIIQRYPAPTGTGQLETDQAQFAWLALASVAGGGGVRQMWVRNPDDDWTKFNPGVNAFPPAAGLVQRLKNFEKKAIAFPLCLRVLQPFDVSAFHGLVDGVTPIGAGNGVILSLKTIVGAPSKTLIVTGFKKPLSRLNGAYVPNSGWYFNTPSLTLVDKDVSANASLNYVSGGKVHSADYQYPPVVNIAIFEPRPRKVGRAFFAARGRRSRR